MKSKIFFVLSLLLFGISFMSAQQSCYEQYLRAHNMLLPTDSMTVDDSYDELKKEVIARQLMREESKLAIQPIRQPIFLAIDTLAGTCHLLAEDGTILADVHLAMVDSTWYMWLSVDPLADKNIANTPYMYCNGNPIMFIDPDGKQWTDIDGNPIQDHSKIKAYIFYNPKDFKSQTIKMYRQLEQKYGKGSVALSDVTTEADFSNDWGDMCSRDIKEVNINHHGNNQVLMLDSSRGEYITATGNGHTNLSKALATNVSGLLSPLGDLTNAQLNLNTCHSNDMNQYPLVGEKLTLLQSFFRYFPFRVARGTKAGVSYGILSTPHPQSNLYLGIIPSASRNAPVWDFYRRGF